MNDEQRDLARRLAAHPRYTLDLHGVSHVRRPCGTLVVRDGRKFALVPDLTDAATGGVLAGMLGSGWVFECCTSSGGATKWKAYLRGYILAKDAAVHCGTTLAEACARALLAEWGEP